MREAIEIMAIIEQYSKDLYEGFEEFKEDYVNTRLTKKELMNKHNLTNIEYERWRKHAISESGFRRKCYGRVKKTRDDLKKILPAVTDDYIDDLRVVDILVKYDLAQNEWNTLRELIRTEYDYVRLKRGVMPRNISHDGDGYFRVQKSIDGKSQFFGKFRKKSTAFKIARAMEKTGWDKSRYWEVRAEVLGV
ncbi:MAG: hypothetical protein Q4P18_07100 [Methanobrevibacter sp.]|uniref:hypothetical protein n=1 Tax=Methanobrevibacter sp. TaxID=66852 RepID=UPI0026E00352|nr:hypothetical protein [Methanobrevibacter sp.]MDO5849284.1 hypothetical protein [Methanobrevibacter sp.]